MTEHLAAAGTGVPTVLVGEKFLHSRYDPVTEAENYIKSMIPRENGGEKDGRVRYLILIEPGLCYGVPALRRRFPRAKIIALHASAFFTRPVPGKPAAAEGTAAWSPGAGITPGEFLEREIPDTAIESVKIVEWRPALAAYGAAYRDLLAEAVRFVRRIDANARTVRGFGRRWFKNFARSLGILRRGFTIERGGAPWIVTGAGPGLEEALPLIAAMQKDGATVLAAASAAGALAAAGVTPALVISTDGGGWARLHLWETIRCGRGAPLFIAASLYAALPCQCGDYPVLPLSDGSRWQEAVLAKMRVPHLAFPQRGTVTAAALDLALYGTSGAVFLAGMDLADDDIKTHARPYAFDRLAEESASRLAPGYSRSFARTRQTDAAAGYRVYAEWFAARVAALPGRVFPLGKNNPLFHRAPPLPAQSRASPPLFSVFPINAPVPSLADLPDTPAFCRELAALLLPGEENPPPSLIRAEILTLTCKQRVRGNKFPGAAGAAPGQGFGVGLAAQVRGAPEEGVGRDRGPASGGDFPLE
jgi:hypothetical protein